MKQVSIVGTYHKFIYFFIKSKKLIAYM